MRFYMFSLDFKRNLDHLSQVCAEESVLDALPDRQQGVSDARHGRDLHLGWQRSLGAGHGRLVAGQGGGTGQVGLRDQVPVPVDEDFGAFPMFFQAFCLFLVMKCGFWTAG